jgi:hypothetical protein
MKQKSLHQFTKMELKINDVLSLEKITHKVVESLSKTEKEYLMTVFDDKITSLKGIELDEFLKKVDSITSPITKNQLWESNHIRITVAIANFIKDYGRMPSKTEIAASTEISRQTVHKHFKEYLNHPYYLEHIEQFSFMTSKLLAKIFQFALNGNIGAAKLYFSVMRESSNLQFQNNTLIQNQNNYIQINGTILSQEAIENLNPEQLKMIEGIVKAALPKSKELDKVDT